MRSSGKVAKDYPVEEPSFCDSMWACILNDYVEDMEETSVLTDPSATEKPVEHKVRRRQERKDRRERRRSSSRNRTRSRSKTRGSSRARRRGSSSHSRMSNRARRESRFEEEEADSGRENTMMISPREVEEIKKTVEDEEAVPIPSVPSREMRKSMDPEDSRRHRRKVDQNPAEQEARPPMSPSKKERKRPPKLTVASFGDDSPRESAPISTSSSKRDEPPPVLFRPIKSRYNPSPKSASSPRVMSPVTSPRSPSNLRVDSAEFNTMEDYQKKVLEARSKRSGRKFERIQAIRAKQSWSQSSKADP